MSTRSRTRSGAPPSTRSTPSKSTTRSHKVTSATQPTDDADLAEKENVKQKSIQAVATNGKSKAAKLEEALCTCTKGDDGSPMVYCAECHVWYHFTCVDLSEPDAEDINVYICPTCAEKTHRQTAMLWEGDDALEGNSDEDRKPARQKTKVKVKTPSSTQAMPLVYNDESEEDPSSEDEYVDEESRPKGKKSSSKRHRSRALSSTSESDSQRRRSLSKASTPAVDHFKRKKSSTATSDGPAAKRKKSLGGPSDDPARKYCLKALEETFQSIFLRYPHVRVNNSEEEDISASKIISKKLEDLSEEEKEALIEESKQFAGELEQCIYDTYAEHDKQGDLHAGWKYKDRFRTLQFNLSKDDRVIIHQRITSAKISPKELSTMSSTDLADEETKQSIMIAEQEALEYSILVKMAPPRAKITHKGLQDIEDINGDVGGSRELEHQRDREKEEERRERERTARLRTSTRQRTTSVSVPPESPTVAQSSSSEPWGAPPSVPLHASSPMDENASGLRTPYVSEPELNLADLINIDDDILGQDSSSSQTAYGTIDTTGGSEALSEDVKTSLQSPTIQSPSTTGISPFAARPDGMRGFDLNALWGVSTEEDSMSPQDVKTPLSPSPTDAQEQLEPKDSTIDHEPMDEANDRDFDMFLDEKEPEPLPTPDPSPTDLQSAFEQIPVVWSGKITMPLDSPTPEEMEVVGRQMGGRMLEHGSPLWSTLFPSGSLRIEGRVPVQNSSDFMLQMRMNPSKELIAAAFLPSTEAAKKSFKTLSDFLIAKGRHGVVFPWGNRPKDYHPGREMYIIPLLANQPLPEFMELLDNLKLPSLRTVDYFVGIWVLNKGKLAPPPAVPVVASASSVIPSLPPNISLPLLNTPTPPAFAPQHPPTIPQLPIIAPSILAAEVASLTPEQIQSVLRTLASTAPLAASLPPPQQTPQPLITAPQPYQQVPPTPPYQQSWQNPVSQPYYPPNNKFTPNSPVHHTPIPPPLHSNPRSPYDSRRQNGHGWSPGHEAGDRDQGRGRRDWAQGPDARGGGDLGRRGGGRGGRGRNRGQHSPQRPADSGWPRRPPNRDGRAGGPS